MDLFKNVLYLIPVMLYYLIESAIIAIFVGAGWKLLMYQPTNFYIGYWQWLFIIWTIKIAFFDVFRLAAVVAENEKNYEKEYNNSTEENN